MSNPVFAVILSGCGHQDGAEIHESTLTLYAIHRHGADYHCFAPNILQHHVLNHITGAEMDDTRNVLIESARIARGNISDLADFTANEFDALILPGGFGAAKNLSDYAFQGADCQINPDVEKAVKTMHGAGKPIGALCISPALIARILPGVKLTIGSDQSTSDNIRVMGAQHIVAQETEIVVDTDNRVVTTPCYMLDSRVDKIAEGVDRTVAALLEMI
ncbi:MAG: isoprenoid biosynthesis glyoxalase ElbB [Desulfocapsaceae bacterium]|nr:isoprenoid biosynthesis glyoxalase ElbB [Desulfocapsaceae bacterium]